MDKRKTWPTDAAMHDAIQQYNTAKTDEVPIRDDAVEAASFGAVILAAGYSSRMKAFKPLLPVGEISAIERVIRTLGSVGISDIIVVTGHCRERLASVICDNGLTEAYNRNYDRGMFSSIKTGLAKAKVCFESKKAFFLMPVDCPLIGKEVLNTMIEAAGGNCGYKYTSESQDFDSFYVPVYEGKKGHPLMIPASHIDEICAYDGPGGLKGITDKYWEKMIRIPVDDEGCLLDMDTPEGYEEINEFLNSGGKRQDIRELARGRRIFFVRHGETVQHDEKIFIGQYDVPLSDAGRKQIERTALELAAEKPRTNRIYTSDLSRAEESAVIIAGRLNCSSEEGGKGSRAQIEDGQSPWFMQLEMLASLREINLGDWDGKKISDIKKEHPEEYERRGAELFAFKTGNKAENFYDMQYRVVNALRTILESEKSQDIIIVTHSGVIRALENNLRGLGVDDPWDRLNKGDFRIVTEVI